MKMYSAFISSAFESLRDERDRVINALLDRNVFPICQEHFTISADNFDELTNYIDNSDFFILLLGSKYGSCDIDNKSWTQKEYEYAKQAGKSILAIKCDEYIDADDKQRSFGENIRFAEQVTDEFTIEKIISKYFGKIDFGDYSGWVRQTAVKKIFDLWKKANTKFNLSGKWYHIHISDDEAAYNYVRVGELTINQTFDEEHYRDLRIDALNFSASLDDNDEIIFDKFKSTEWGGDYKLYIYGEKGEIKGVYSANRKFTDKYKNELVNRGIKKGIHEFSLFGECDAPVDSFEGEFNDVTPSPKRGRIFVFRSVDDRNKFLINHLKEIKNCLNN